MREILYSIELGRATFFAVADETLLSDAQSRSLLIVSIAGQDADRSETAVEVVVYRGLCAYHAGLYHVRRPRCADGRSIGLRFWNPHSIRVSRLLVHPKL